MIGFFPSLFNDSSPVQVLDGETFGVLFSSASPMRVAVQDDKLVTRFQVENGEERSDHIVKNAIEIGIEFILSDDQARTQFENMRQAYEENRLVTIQTRMRSYDNMLIEGFPHEEIAIMSGGAVLPLRFVEWREIAPEYGELQQNEVADPKQASTVDRGNQRGADVPAQSETQRKGSIAYEWMNK